MASKDDPAKDQIDEKWTEERDDEIHAPWEELVAAILHEGITEHVDVSSQSQMGCVESDKAAQNLVSEVDEIESTEHAEALLETLRQEKIIEKKGDKIVALRNVSDQPENPNYLYNWAAAMQLARVKIEDQIERARELDKQLQEDLEDIQSIGAEFVEEDPQERIPEQYTIEQGKPTDVNIQAEIENFQHLQQALMEFETQLRTIIQTNKWQNKKVGTMLDGLIDMISEIAMLDQGIEEMSHDKIENTLGELTDSKDQAYEAGEQITDGEQDEQVQEELEGQDKEEFSDSFEE